MCKATKVKSDKYRELTVYSVWIFSNYCGYVVIRRFSHVYHCSGTSSCD